MTESVIVTGAGGVGKTTLSAALGASLAARGNRVLVLTIDPAKRLADALGIDDLGDEAQPVGGNETMWASMLDVTASWEGIVHRYAEPEVADRLLVNNYFRAIADRFPAAQSFAAAERMSEEIESGQYDVVVVDTPPSGGGIDFFRAPARTGELISGRLLRWLTGSNIPGRSIFYRVAAKPALKLADTVLGGPMLSDVADFLLDLRTMYDALSRRSRTMERHLRNSTTLIATTADPTPIAETRRFFRELGDIKIAPHSIVFNRMLPADWLDASEAHEIDASATGVQAAAIANLEAWAGEARRQIDAARELEARYHRPVHAIPWMPHPPTDLASLRELLEASSISEELASFS